MLSIPRDLLSPYNPFVLLFLFPMVPQRREEDVSFEPCCPPSLPTLSSDCPDPHSFIRMGVSRTPCLLSEGPVGSR